MNRKLYAISACLLLMLGVNSFSQGRKELSEAEAVQKAERFIAEQGYTDLPPTKDKSKLRPEPVNGGTQDFWIEKRRNSLERKAYGVLKEGGENGYWVIVFQCAKDPKGKCARAVSVHPNGKDIRIWHQGFNLEFAKLKKIAR